MQVHTLVLYIIVFEALRVLGNYFHKTLLQKAVDLRAAHFETFEGLTKDPQSTRRM